MEQRTENWFSARLGKLTASNMARALDLTAKGAEGAKRKTYRLELIAERITGQPTPFFENAAMRHGTECEPLARSAYEAETGVMVQEVGFIPHQTIEWSGASPDGLVKGDGLIEIKCPTTSTHIQYRIDGVVPDDYKPQMLWQLACTGRKWCDFVSFDPRLPEELQLFVVRFEPTAEVIEQIELKAIEFLESVEELYNKLVLIK